MNRKRQIVFLYFQHFLVVHPSLSIRSFQFFWLPFIHFFFRCRSWRQYDVMRTWKEKKMMRVLVWVIWIVWTLNKFRVLFISFHFLNCVLKKSLNPTPTMTDDRQPTTMMSNSNRAIVVSIKIDFMSRTRRIKWSYKVALYTTIAPDSLITKQRRGEWRQQSSNAV